VQLLGFVSPLYEYRPDSVTAQTFLCLHEFVSVASYFSSSVFICIVLVIGYVLHVRVRIDPYVSSVCQSGQSLRLFGLFAVNFVGGKK